MNLITAIFLTQSLLLHSNVAQAFSVKDASQINETTKNVGLPNSSCSIKTASTQSTATCDGPYEIVIYTYDSAYSGPDATSTSCFLDEIVSANIADLDIAKGMVKKLFKSQHPFHYNSAILDTANGASQSTLTFCQRKFSNPTNIKIDDVNVFGKNSCVAYKLEKINLIDDIFY